MKRLIVVLAVVLQITFSTATFAWSPLDGFESVVEEMEHCYFTVAASEQGEEGENSKEEEEEEEPDCD